MPAASRRMRHRKWRTSMRSLRLALMQWLRTKTKCRTAFGMRHNGSATLTIFHSALFRAASNVPMHHGAKMSTAERLRSRQIRETDAIGIALRATLWQFAVVQWSRGSRQIHTEIFQLQRSLVGRWSSENGRHRSGERTRDTIDRSATRGHLRFGIAGRALVCAEPDQIVFGRRACSVLVAEPNTQRSTSQHFLFGHLVGHRGASKSFIANENVPLWLRAMQWCDRIGHQLQCTALHAARVPRSPSTQIVGRVEFELDVSGQVHTATREIWRYIIPGATSVSNRWKKCPWRTFWSELAVIWRPSTRRTRFNVNSMIEVFTIFPINPANDNSFQIHSTEFKVAATESLFNLWRGIFTGPIDWVGRSE